MSVIPRTGGSSSRFLRTSLLRSGTSDYLQILGTQYGIRSSVTTQSRLDLPGRSAPTCV